MIDYFEGMVDYFDNTVAFTVASFLAIFTIAFFLHLFIILPSGIAIEKAVAGAIGTGIGTGLVNAARLGYTHSKTHT